MIINCKIVELRFFADLHRDKGRVLPHGLFEAVFQRSVAWERLAEEAGIRSRVKNMVGGAPISEAFCREIGADAYTPDAAEAARVAVSLLGNKTM